MKIGGIETSFYNLSRYLSDKGHEVSVRYAKADPMRIKRYIDAGIDIQKEKIETCDVLLVGSIWRRPKQIVARVTVQQVHADWSDDFWGKASSPIMMLKAADGECDVFSPVSNSSGNFVGKYVTKPIITMNNLAPKPMKIKRGKNQKLIIGAFTRMTTEKGLKNYELLRDRLKELNIDAELRVYTNGEAPDGWTLYEPVPDIRTEFSNIDFVASLADTESFGYTIAEANSCGVPCIIKRTHSTGEFFSDKDNIILDSVSDITAKMLNQKHEVTYTLREATEQNIDTAIKEFERLANGKCIIKSMKAFKDLEANKRRQLGEVFAVTNKRAQELLSNELNLVKRVS